MSPFFKKEKKDTKQFFYDLGIKIQEAVRKDLKEIMCKVGDEKVYAVALVTDTDCVTLYLAINTIEYMKKRDEEYLVMLQNDLSKEQIQNVEDGTISFTKWTPAEWGYTDERDSELNKICELLLAKGKSNPKEYTRQAALFFETLTSAFKYLIDTKVFGENLEDITFFISMSDDERTYDIEDYSAKLLNSETVYNEFLNRTEL